MSRRRTGREKLQLGPWPLDPPKPELGKLVRNAIDNGNGADMAALAAEIREDIDLDDKMIAALRNRLSREIYQRRQLSTALKGILVKREQADR